MLRAFCFAPIPLLLNALMRVGILIVSRRGAVGKRETYRYAASRDHLKLRA
jgi:hypothetical protein